MDKISELRIKSYQNQVLSKFSYLDIKHLYSPLDFEYENLYTKFHNLNKVCIASFPFHHNGIINKEDFCNQKKEAEKIFITKINSISESFVYLTLTLNGFSFWAKLETVSLKHNLSRLVSDRSCGFMLFTDNGFSLELYSAEYEWEIWQSGAGE